MKLAKLIDLQKIDNRLLELESFRGDLPEVVHNLKHQYQEQKDALNEKQNEREDTDKAIIKNNSENEDFNVKLNKYQEQIYSVKNNKEYDAITAEIEALEKKIDENELLAVELLEKKEKIEQEIAIIQSELKRLEQELSENEADLKEKMAQTAKEEQSLQKQRELVKSQIDRKLYYTYERIRKGKGGVALSGINNYTCNECFATIPAQTVVEVRKRDQLILCEVCGRILIPEQSNIKEIVESN